MEVGRAGSAWQFVAMSDASPDQLALGAEFPPATREQWLALVEHVLKGASFRERLISETYDALPVDPLSPRRPNAVPVRGRAPGKGWAVMQRADHPDPAAANDEAAHDLANGGCGLAIEFAGAAGAYGYGLPEKQDAIARALEGIDLSRIVLDLDLGPRPNDAPGSIAALVQSRGLQASSCRIRFGLDPLGAAALAGGSAFPWSTLRADLSRNALVLANLGFPGPFATADARIVHNAGASEAQELAYALAVGVEYLRALAAGGASLDDARRMLYFRLSCDADELMSVAKFRALRKLWARVEAACGLSPVPVLVAAETAWRMMTRRDPYVNMLRSTIAAVAAGLGGADAITVLPFTMPLGLPDRFARRVARNTQLVLLEEASLAKVADPAAGSGTVEDLTDRLCRAAWTEFQRIEKAGGAWAALQAGQIQKGIAAVRTRRQTALALRKETLTGTTEFANLTEPAVAVAAVSRPEAPTPQRTINFEALTPDRLAMPFEALRDASDRVLARTGARPAVFLANLGALSDFGARATFAKNLFEVAGIETLPQEGFADCQAMIAAFEQSGARLACLCSSDEIYDREGKSAAQALRAAGAVVWLAGKPRHAAALEQAGVSGFIFAGCDALAALQAAHAVLAA
jgi:methylmalonyl-CoA mutase